MYKVIDKSGRNVISTSNEFVARVAEKFVSLGADRFIIPSASMVTKYIHDLLGMDEDVIVNWVYDNYDVIAPLSVDKIVEVFKQGQPPKEE